MPLTLNQIYHDDCVIGLKKLPTSSADIIIADPPYNINKNFGNNKMSLSINSYVAWCLIWIHECLRILKPTGTMFIYGFSEVLAYLFVKIKVKKRWLVWHYTNKTVPTLKDWQRSHESIICCWKEKRNFNRDVIREPYSPSYAKLKPNTPRRATPGRFSNGQNNTFYHKHPGGALPRDVIKIPALAGGAGKREGVNHPAQKPKLLTEKLILSALNPATKTNLVVVPFAGSGTECLISKKLNCDYIGFEVNAEYIKLSQSRINQLLLQKQPQLI